MSEFSDSLHFYNISIQDLKAGLKELHIQAFILNENEPPFAVLMDWENKSKTRSIACSLDFSYGEDHGIFCKFYSQGKFIARANKAWGPDFGIEEPEDSPNFPGISSDFVQAVVGANFIDMEAANELVTVFNEYDGDDYTIQEEFITKVGDLLGLKQYRNLQCEDLQYNLDSLLEINPNGKIN